MNKGLAAQHIYQQQKLIAVFVQSLQLFGHLYNIHLIGMFCLWDYFEESCRSHNDAVVQLIHFQVLILGGVVEHFSWQLDMCHVW